MARPPEWRKQPDVYPQQQEMHTRFQDIDPNRHLNNVAFASLFENARVQMHKEARPWADRPRNERTMVVELTVNYLGEGSFPEPVTVCTGVGKLGTSSWTIYQAMFQDGRCIATSDSVIACRTDGEAKPLRAELRESLEKLLVSEPAEA